MGTAAAVEEQGHGPFEAQVWGSLAQDGDVKSPLHGACIDRGARGMVRI